MMAATAAQPLRIVRPTKRGLLAPPVVVLQTAAASDAPAIHALILDHLQEGRLLPRRVEEIAAHADRFVVAVDGSRIVACAELAPLSRSLAEVRSLVVSADARRLGLGHRIVHELSRRAIAAGFHKLCAFAHAPAYFVQMGFSIVPHTWLSDKIAVDCHACPQFRGCAQYAVVKDLIRPRDAFVPLAALRG